MPHNGAPGSHFTGITEVNNRTLGAWREQAACRDANPDLFFADSDDTAPAIAICGGCEVRAECLNYALKEKQDEGVWGGLTAKQRINRRRKSRPELRAARERRMSTS